MSKSISRRGFLKVTGAAAAAATLNGPSYGFFTIRRRAPRLGIIGVANRGGDNLFELVRAGAKIAALCDVDERYLDDAKKAHPDAKAFLDYRELIDAKVVDAVVVSTPDHHHAPATLRALRAGLHAYCEKPLAHTVAEARAMADAVRGTELKTQMGTQIHAGENYRRVVEAVRARTVGEISEVHVFCNGKTWSGGDRPKDVQEPPKTFHWDLWLGPAESRPYHSSYHPANWRRFWAFGGGTLADMGCHYTDLAFWALDLDHPTRVAAEGPAPHAETTPSRLVVHLDYPAKAGRSACRLHWWDGGAQPDVLDRLGLAAWQNGVLFIGEKGWLIADYDRLKLGPDDKAKDFKLPPPSIAKSIGHHKEWLEAIEGRGTTTCPFPYSGALTESILLGNVAYRAQKAFSWDAAKLTAVDCPEAQALITKAYRDGWKI